MGRKCNNAPSFNEMELICGIDSLSLMFVFEWNGSNYGHCPLRELAPGATHVCTTRSHL